MASTNKTTHYELPQWIGTDKPTFLGDLNQAFEDIDTGIYNAATAASNAASAAGSAQSAASTAQSAAESAASTASAANTLATTANTNAVSALNSIGSTPLQTTAQTLTAAVNEVLHDVPDDATDIPYDNQTSGLTATNVQAAIDEIAQGGGGGGGSESVSVTGDGVKTVKALLEELFALVDSTKVTPKAVLKTNTDVFQLAKIDTNTYEFSRVYLDTTTLYNAYWVVASTSSAKRTSIASGSVTTTDISSNTIASGNVITFTY